MIDNHNSHQSMICYDRVLWQEWTPRWKTNRYHRDHSLHLPRGRYSLYRSYRDRCAKNVPQKSTDMGLKLKKREVDGFFLISPPHTPVTFPDKYPSRMFARTERKRGRKLLSSHWKTTWEDIENAGQIRPTLGLRDWVTNLVFLHDYKIVLLLDFVNRLACVMLINAKKIRVVVWIHSKMSVISCKACFFARI